MEARDLRKTKFQIDTLGDQEFDGFTTGETWNGFACPYFRFAEAQRVLAACKALGDQGYYDAATDEFVFTGLPPEPWDESQRFGPTDVKGLGKLYAIGAAMWIWSEVEGGA